jgi:hypothetical protein
MITLKDCGDFCALTEDEVDAIAKHEHMPEISAAERGGSLLQSEEGVREITRFIREDIANAKLHDHPAKAIELERVLAHFMETHHA